MMPNTLRKLTAAAVAIALLGGTGAVPMANAQSTQQSAPQAGPGEFSDEQLKSFAEASLEVEDLNRKWQPKMSGATGEQEQAQAREQAMQEMMLAVREAGLSVEEYNQIVSAMQIDPDTARAVQEYRAELQ
jgi:Spy/CpxP family protein refolding chaperone